VTAAEAVAQFVEDALVGCAATAPMRGTLFGSPGMNREDGPPTYACILGAAVYGYAVRTGRNPWIGYAVTPRAAVYAYPAVYAYHARYGDTPAGDNDEHGRDYALARMKELLNELTAEEPS
jgi:hypothetical protein